MFAKLRNTLSLGERYLWASMLYAGMSLLLLGIVPEIPKAFACPDCEEGMVAVQTGEGCNCQCPESPDEE